MSKNIYSPKDNIPKIYEVREIENQDLKNKLKTQNIENSVEKNVQKVFRNLIWKNKKGQEFYRVFGSWKCDNQKKNCNKGWNSAYTWILLQKYKDRVSVKALDKNKDYYQQVCKSCNNKVNLLVKYEHIKKNEDEKEIKPHRTDLCVKCQTDEKCWDFIKYQQQIGYRNSARFFLGSAKRFFRLR